MKVDRRCSVLRRGVSKESCTGTSFSSPEGRKIVAQDNGVGDGGHSRPLPWVRVLYIESISTAVLFEALRPMPRAGERGWEVGTEERYSETGLATVCAL